MTVCESKAVQYALWCIRPDNQRAPIYVKKQCAAWLEIVNGRDPEAYVCEKTFKKICNILKIIMHPDLIKPDGITHCSLYESLEPYAWLLIIAVFCTKTTDGHWYYKTALLEIARKNFKTFNSAVIFIIGMLTGRMFGRYFSVAPDLKLSSELQKAIRKIIKSSPALDTSDIFKPMRNEIRCIVTDSEYTPLAYSEDKMDGKLANMFLADEAGAMDSYPIEAMRSSQITLRDKLGIIISTQYPNDNNAMITEIDKAKKILDGFLQNKRYFALLYEPNIELTTGDQWQTNDLIIYQSNPVACNNEFVFNEILDLRADAILYENKRENFLCKHCNILYKSLGTEGYVEITKVRECRIKEDLKFWRGKRVWIGLDLSLSEDNTAVAMLTEDNGRFYCKAWGFIPANRVDIKSDKENVDYRRLIREGACFDCGDEIVDYNFIEHFILDIIPEKYGVEIAEAGYDRWNAISTAQKLEAEAITCVEIKQHSSVLHRPTKMLKEAILSKGFSYDENELLEINFSNARCTEDTNLNKFVNKKKSAGKVDLVVAVINALYLLQQDMECGSWGAQVIE